MRVLVTRPQPDADDTATLLRARGHTPIIAPLLEIHPVEHRPPLDLNNVQAFLVTSANGVRALAQNTDNRELPVLAVGAASGEKAREAGFLAVESADGDVVALAELVLSRLSPTDGRLLHAAGTVTAGDLAARLQAGGLIVDRAVLYRARTLEELPESVVIALKAREIDAVLLYSPRTARTFLDLVAKAGIVETLSEVNAYCLSAAVASVAAELGFQSVRISKTPDQMSLFDILT